MYTRRKSARVNGSSTKLAARVVYSNLDRTRSTASARITA
jgi:hypothetical protein